MRRWVQRHHWQCEVAADSVHAWCDEICVCAYLESYYVCFSDPGHSMHSCVLTLLQLSGIVKFCLSSPPPPPSADSWRRSSSAPVCSRYAPFPPYPVQFHGAAVRVSGVAEPEF